MRRNSKLKARVHDIRNLFGYGALGPIFVVLYNLEASGVHRDSPEVCEYFMTQIHLRMLLLINGFNTLYWKDRSFKQSFYK